MKNNIILLHGALGAACQFEQITKLLENQYNLHTFDFQGHGKNHSNQSFSIQLFVQNLKQYIDDNYLAPAKIFGYSMGGYVALNLACSEPELIAKIVTLGTKFDWNTETASKEAKMLNADKIEEKVPKFADYLKSLHGDERWRIVLEKTAEMMINMGDGKGVLDNEKLIKLTLPISINIGENDAMVTKEESQKIADLLPNSTFKTIPNIPHPIDKIAPEIIANLIKEEF